MPLQKKLDEGDQDLLMLMTDPIFFTEFLNNTNYGDLNRNNWFRGAEPFKLRPYQREIITDRTKNIVITGGRSIGKCQPASARIYTTDGFQSITTLKDLNHFAVYAVDDQNAVRMRRATITKDVKKPVYTLKTQSGHILQGTDVHPVLTRKGYKLLADLEVGEDVAVVRRLPTTHLVIDTLFWHEARLLGYMALQEIFPAELALSPRFPAIKAELEFIAKKFFCVFKYDKGKAYLKRKRGGTYLHPINYLKKELGFKKLNLVNIKSLAYMKRQSLQTIQVFLEALFAQYAFLSRKDIYLHTTSPTIADDLQELLLYFGIESRIDREDDQHRLTILNERARYLFWTQFTLPGVEIGKLLPPPAQLTDINDYLRWDTITELTLGTSPVETYSVHVYKDETYFSNYIVNHNSVILENILIYQIVNSQLEFPETAEQVLATPNQNQLTPLLDKVTRRFDSSPLLKDWLIGKNLSRGTFDYYITEARQHRLYARIAGSKSENNIVGLHVSRLAVDEAQLFPMPTWYQMQPILNVWEQRSQQMYSGVNV